MPSTVTEYTLAAQEQTLSAIKQSQQVVVEAVRTWAKSIEKAVPEAPAVPYAEQLPTPLEVLETSFGFAEQLLRTQKEFAENLLAATSPIVKSKSQPVAKAPASA